MRAPCKGLPDCLRTAVKPKPVATTSPAIAECSSQAEFIEVEL